MLQNPNSYLKNKTCKGVKARFQPMGAPAPDSQHAEFRTEDCEQAFVALKHSAIHAVELAVPDLDGAMDATDNCLETPNPGQLDADGDGFGNACDADLNNDGWQDLVVANGYLSNTRDDDL